jgi:serine/threonine-protein kinase
MVVRTLGRYRIEEQVGAGGMGVVYRARDTELKRTVAIKVIGQAPRDAGTRAAILREARAASALNHPNICTVYEVGEFEGLPYVVMEHVEGRTLDALVPPDGLSAEAAVRYGIQVADALAHAHDRGVIHRDLKGSNIMVTAEGRAKVLDFGLASRVRDDQRRALTESDASADQAHDTAGTVAYMAPQALQGQPPDPRDDIWALGVLLYESITGERPFRGVTKFEVASAIQRDAPGPLPPRIAPGLRSVILRCLARDRNERYQHARELKAALEAVQSSVPFTGPSWRTRIAGRPAAIALGLVAATAAAIVAGRAPGMWTNPVESVAVLPFVNTGNDPDIEYLSDGLTEALIASLSTLPQDKLKVIALGPVLHYKGDAVDLVAAGRDLGVGALVIGRVVPRGGAFSVTVELVSARDRSRLWGGKYEGTVHDILTVQQEIAGGISKGLRLSLTADDRQRMAKQQTDDGEAYELYLKGRYQLAKYTPEGYEAGLRYFHQAIERDSRYALAYAGIAMTRATMGYEGLVPPGEALREAESAALRSVALDDTLGAAHEALATVRFAKDWNWPAAEQEYRRAVSLSGDASTRRFYGFFLRNLGRWDEALAETQAAVALDPFSVETSKALGAAYLWAGQHDRAIDQFQKALELDANHAPTHDLLADAYAAKGLYADALKERRASLILEGADEAAEALGTDVTADGYRRAMRVLHAQYLEALEEASAEGYVSPMAFAMIHAALGDTKAALSWLEKAYDERAPWLVTLKSDPAFDPLRGDRRFQELVRRVGLP